uniref:Putative salivary secreted protein n=1 Tax=Ixodes ricinus TaxID=34613 RepID=A0A147BXS6_IXORI
MNAAFIAAFLILGATTLDATASEEDLLETMCIYNDCESDEDCGPSPNCKCIPPRGDDYRSFCGNRTD